MSRAYNWTIAQIDEMMLGDIRNLTAEWPSAPPLVFLVEALVKGFSGGPSLGSQDSIEPQNDVGKFAAAVDPRAIPVVREDKGLPQKSPVFDMEAMQRKNRQIIVEAHLKKAQSRAGR